MPTRHERRLDPLKTAPFELGEGEDVCLLLHGFTGSPWDMRPLGEALAGRGFRVKAIRLPGHGTTPAAMEGATHADWQAAAEEALISLGRTRNVYVAGLSMGALLAVLLAARHPERVGGLALLAPAMRFRGRAMRLLRAMRRLPMVELLQPWIPKSGTDLEDAAALAEAPVLPAFPSARLDDLWRLQDAARANLEDVRAPTLVAVATHDHVVSIEGGRELAQGLTRAREVRFLQLDQGFHIMPRDRGRHRLLAEVGDFFSRLRQR